MLEPSVRALILSEQERHRFIDNDDVDAYLAKLAGRAEFLSAAGDGRCRGVVAYYANDQVTRRGFITLVVVNPLDRGAGLGRALVSCVLELMKQRGLAACRLEVAHANTAARALYGSLGFAAVEGREHRDLLEIIF